MSHIKGGGRAQFSEQVEEALTSVLLALREPHIQITSEHDRKREHRRFLRTLKDRHERQALTKKVNPGQQGKKNALDTTVAQVLAWSQRDAAQPAKHRKVRMELVEAIFGSSKKEGKKGGTQSSSDPSVCLQDGAKKTLVFAASTSIENVMKEAKTKLRMKKKPVRCFVVHENIAVDLVGDLRGIKDGDKVYVTSQQEAKQSAVPEEENKLDGEPPDSDEFDPLAPVKEAYRQRKRHQRSPRQTSRTIPLEHPDFTSYLEQLISLPPERANLPAATCRESILEALSTNQVMIVCGETGCGKSTQLPQFLLEGMTAAGLRDNTSILVTQPRRVAATALAQRVATEMQSPEPGQKGSEVGYMVRLDRAVSDDSKIVYCTVGILVRMLVCPQEESDMNSSNAVPLANITHVVVDEVHERDVNTDFVLTLLRNVLNVNKQIRVVLMSATASTQLFARYFEKAGMKSTVVYIPGRSFPVDIKWISECERFAGSHVKGWSPKIADAECQTKNLSPRAPAKIDCDFIKSLVVAIVRKQQADGMLNITCKDGSRQDGAILVFLPGKAEIEALAKALYSDPLVGDRRLCNILKLHSTIPSGGQRAVFIPAREGMVKIVLSTNIAETSITISDVSEVIDCGRVKESRFNVKTRIKELVTVWTSQASAQQRAGRAGRTSAGNCWRLYSEGFSKDAMAEATSPEILRTPLDELVMQLNLLYENKRDGMKETQRGQGSTGVCPIRFLRGTPEPPSDESLIEACKHLLEVGALTVVAREPTIMYRLTPLGYHLSRLPMDAKVGKVLLVGCMLGCLENSLTVASALSNTKSCFRLRWGSLREEDWQSCVLARKTLAEKSFGGCNWPGGTVKGDLTATIGVYREWAKRNDNERKAFCAKLGLDNQAMKEMASLRLQFRDCLKDAGFVGAELDSCNNANDDALLTSCCFVAGLYPNICTLMRPRKGGPRGGRLLTKDGDVCRPSMASFQTDRVRNVSETGRDAYAVFHAKHRSVGTGGKVGDVFLSDVDFVSRFALLLFGGELAIERNALILDSWLKFKIGGDNKGNASLVLIQELRCELDNLLLRHVVPGVHNQETNENNDKLVLLLRKLLTDEV